jgi:diacylglycerol O-acyltransferase / wax synthase
MGDRMTALDAAFYHLERAGQLLHVGGVYTTDGPLDFERTLADLTARLHLIPRYTQRVVPVPFNLGHPTWEPARGFDIRNHVVRHKLRGAGDDEQLRSLASRLFAEPLDRAQPLWELHQIDGYRGDRSAILAKVHHAMIDGVSGVQLLGVMFDPSPTPAPPPPAPDAAESAPPPTPSVQAVRALEDAAATAVEGLRTLRELLRRPARAWEELQETASATAEMLRLVLAPPPNTPFNGFVGSQRRIEWITFSLNEIKAMKNRLGGTVNDVILATITGALRRYLEDRGWNPDRVELRALCPVNVRTKDEHLKLGNRVSAMMAPLPVGILDPLERLRQVRTAMEQVKRSGESARMMRLMELLSYVPAPLQHQLGWFQIFPVNTICTNVPGPPVSLYFQGRRLDRMIPLVPLAQGVGLAFAILSYADSITIGANLDPGLITDGQRITAHLRESFDELRGLAGVKAIGAAQKAVPPERQRRRPATPSQVA